TGSATPSGRPSETISGPGAPRERASSHARPAATSDKNPSRSFTAPSRVSGPGKSTHAASHEAAHHDPAHPAGHPAVHRDRPRSRKVTRRQAETYRDRSKLRRIVVTL